MTKVIIGSSATHNEGWLSSEEDFLDVTKLDDFAKIFVPNSVSAFLAEHVWEHLTLEEGLTGAKHCLEYLKEGGHLRIAVPDGFHPDDGYIEYVKVGGFGAGADDHKVLYNYKSLREVLWRAGFSRIDLLEYFDESGIFHKSEWNKEDGFITRSFEHDTRNFNRKPNYTSLIVDAFK